MRPEKLIKDENIKTRWIDLIIYFLIGKLKGIVSA